MRPPPEGLSTRNDRYPAGLEGEGLASVSKISLRSSAGSFLSGQASNLSGVLPVWRRGQLGFADLDVERRALRSLDTLVALKRLV